VIPLFFRGPRQNKCLRENKMGRVVAELFFAQDCEPACRLPAALKFLAYPILKIFNAGSRNNLIVGNHRSFIHPSGKRKLPEPNDVHAKHHIGIGTVARGPQIATCRPRGYSHLRNTKS
jgi:hypothetical protein